MNPFHSSFDNNSAEFLGAPDENTIITHGNPEADQGYGHMISSHEGQEMHEYHEVSDQGDQGHGYAAFFQQGQEMPGYQESSHQGIDIQGQGDQLDHGHAMVFSQQPQGQHWVLGYQETHQGYQGHEHVAFFHQGQEIPGYQESSHQGDHGHEHAAFFQQGQEIPGYQESSHQGIDMQGQGDHWQGQSHGHMSLQQGQQIPGQNPSHYQAHIYPYSWQSSNVTGSFEHTSQTFLEHSIGNQAIQSTSQATHHQVSTLNQSSQIQADLLGYSQANVPENINSQTFLEYSVGGQASSLAYPSLSSEDPSVEENILDDSSSIVSSNIYTQIQGQTQINLVQLLLPLKDT
ncbi:hypothetical protein L210DRAFT_3646105 [Boletus edulis BED1]|uniref:Uncharacterized protein n=1 Tax=Boletus edulis BED1 TaxID=1328754 RepID=A0AAD4BTZ8_BOLED|nr:hypothetical protein L210DRAFT_3646105 [Boletus edulis BED1]